MLKNVALHVCCRYNRYLLQFPLKPEYAELQRYTTARFKPGACLLELEHMFEKDQHERAENELGRSLPKTQMLRSMEVSQKASLAAGVFREGALHITPVYRCLQLRPTSNGFVQGAEEVYDLDDVDSEGRPLTAGGATASKGLESVTVRRKESDKVLAARKNTYAYKRVTQEAERWSNLQIHFQEDDYSGEVFEKMFTHSNADIQFTQDNVKVIDGEEEEVRMDIAGAAEHKTTS